MSMSNMTMPLAFVVTPSQPFPLGLTPARAAEQMASHTVNLAVYAPGLAAVDVHFIDAAAVDQERVPDGAALPGGEHPHDHDDPGVVGGGTHGLGPRPVEGFGDLRERVPEGAHGRLGEHDDVGVPPRRLGHAGADEGEVLLDGAGRG